MTWLDNLGEPKSEASREDLLTAEYERPDSPTEGYHNYGDINPEAHGGLWVKMVSDDKFRVIETWPAVEIGAPLHLYAGSHDVDPDSEEAYRFQYVEEIDVCDEDLFDASGEFTGIAAGNVEAISNWPDSLEEIVAGGYLSRLAGEVGRDLPARRHRSEHITVSNYQTILDRYDIDPIQEYDFKDF